MNRLEKLSGILSGLFGERAGPVREPSETSKKATRSTRAPRQTIEEGPRPPGMIGHAVRRQEFQRAMRSERRQAASQTCTKSQEALKSTFNRNSAKQAARLKGIRDTFNEQSNNQGRGR